jgi:hypothetical protein
MTATSAIAGIDPRLDLGNEPSEPAVAVLRRYAEHSAGRLPQAAGELHARASQLEQDARQPLRLDPQRGLNLREWFRGVKADLKHAATLHASAITLEAIASDLLPPPWPTPEEIHAQAARHLPAVFASLVNENPTAAITDIARIASDHAEFELEQLQAEKDAAQYVTLTNLEEFHKAVRELQRHAELTAFLTRVHVFTERFPQILGQHLTAVLADDALIATALAKAAAAGLPSVDLDPELAKLQADADDVIASCDQTLRQAACAGMLVGEQLRDRRVLPLQNAIKKRRSQLEAERRELVLMASDGFLPIPAAARAGDGEAVWTILTAATARPELFPEGLVTHIRLAIGLAIAETGASVFAELFE